MLSVLSVPGFLFFDRLRLFLLGLLLLWRWHGLLQVSIELRHDACGQKSILRWLGLLLNATSDILGLDIRTVLIIVYILRRLLHGVRQLVDLFWRHCLNR